jgi:hypothetical protein
MKIFPHSYVSRLRTRLADLLEVRPGGRLREPLGAYEKARINRFLNVVHAGRMTPDVAQQAIAAAWIREYGPRRQPAWLRLLLPANYRHTQGQA